MLKHHNPSRGREGDRRNARGRRERCDEDETDGEEDTHVDATQRTHLSRKCRRSVPQPVVLYPDKCSSAIGKHLCVNQQCREMYRDSDLSVVCHGRSSRHLEMLEALFLHTHKPDLCIRKNNVAPLKLFDKLTLT